MLPNLQLISKTQRLKNPWIPSFIQDFKQFATEDRDLLLCPYRALRVYLDRTNDSRMTLDTDSLSLTYQIGVTKAASKNTLARWIVSLLRYVHEDINLKLFYVRAHDTRRLSSFLGIIQWSFDK